MRIVSGESRVADRRIDFVDWPSESVIVTSGLKPGERILSNPDAAQPGETVKLRTDE